ncbi:hypothetical protein JH282_11925 [Xanthomonas campestris pv. campestris]|nr:hypothetical protein [Xanthomonas campestris pv. campestris]WDJ79002.1 hypothetical protein JH282_11925 [Xanthomonas campestris pv. campestris]
MLHARRTTPLLPLLVETVAAMAVETVAVTVVVTVAVMAAAMAVETVAVMVAVMAVVTAMVTVTVTVTAMVMAERFPATVMARKGARAHRCLSSTRKAARRLSLC